MKPEFIRAALGTTSRGMGPPIKEEVELLEDFAMDRPPWDNYKNEENRTQREVDTWCKLQNAVLAMLAVTDLDLAEHEQVVAQAAYERGFKERTDVQQQLLDHLDYASSRLREFAEHLDSLQRVVRTPP